VKRKFAERFAFRLYAFAWSRPFLYEWSVRIARLSQRVVVKQGRIGKVSGFIARIAPPFGAWTASRDAPPIAQRTFREQWREDSKLK
jgi:L-lactate dehydrogenase complex protein LldF